MIRLQDSRNYFTSLTFLATLNIILVPCHPRRSPSPPRRTTQMSLNISCYITSRFACLTISKVSLAVFPSSKISPCSAARDSVACTTERRILTAVHRKQCVHSAKALFRPRKVRSTTYWSHHVHILRFSGLLEGVFMFFRVFWNFTLVSKDCSFYIIY